MVILVKLGNNFTCVLSKTRLKLFPNFTRHHLITHTYRHYQQSSDINERRTDLIKPVILLIYLFIIRYCSN